MGVTTDDLFGGEARGEPAVPGSYGEAPSGHRLPEATRLGPVKLAVGDIERSLDYYGDVLGLGIVRREGNVAVLAAADGDTPLVELHESPGAEPALRRGRLGLYHFAILLPDRPSLGRFVRHLGSLGAHAGAADHLVSEAVYLQDPDQLGIEVYADRPRGAWRRVGRQLMMATDPLDTSDLVAAAGEDAWTGMPAGTAIGHVHLHVGNIDEAAAFYSEALGFDRMVWSYPGALFLSAGGYHHHLGTNIWAGADAQPASDDEARLLEWTIEVPAAGDVSATAASVKRAGYAVEREPDAAVMRDPWGTPLRVRVAANARGG